MVEIYELETRNGRVFRVAVANKNQLNRLMAKVDRSKGKYQEFINVKVVTKGIHDIKAFEKTADTLFDEEK